MQKQKRQVRQELEGRLLNRNSLPEQLKKITKTAKTKK